MNGGVSQQPPSHQLQNNRHQGPPLAPVLGHSISNSQGVARTITASSTFQSLTPEQQSRIQDDLADRERQASALAAAGMVAERVSLTRPAIQPPVGQVLQAPPPLVGIAPPSPSHPGVAMEGINWNMVDLGSTVVDDMDMDFATLFDPEHEQAHMQTVGSGWPIASNPEKVSTTAGSSPPQHAYHTEVPPETAAMTSTTHLQPQAESSASNSSSHAYAQAVDCSPRRMNNALSSQAKSDQKRHVHLTPI